MRHLKILAIAAVSTFGLAACTSQTTNNTTEITTINEVTYDDNALVENDTTALDGNLSDAGTLDNAVGLTNAQ